MTDFEKHEQSLEQKSYVRNLLVLFGIVYFSQGIAQFSGLLNQPLMNYFKTLGYEADAAAAYFAILTIPWMIKPLYGLISDYFPLLGYRRKSWLCLMNGLACLAFLWLTGLTEANQILIAMLLTAVGTAASDVIVDALMVENGQKFNATGKFQAVQWLFFFTAAIGTAYAGGKLCSYLSAGDALHVAAMITAVAPLLVVVSCWFFVKEEKSRMNVAQLKATTGGIYSALRSKTLWAVALFIAFWKFSPSIGMPLYFHMTKGPLQFDEGFWGNFMSMSAVGSLIGCAIYFKFFAKTTLRFQLIFSILSGTLGTLAYLLLLEPNPYSKTIAISLAVIFGAAGMIATLTVLTLAARACPSKAEGFTFALLMSLSNGVQELASVCGSYMYVNWFSKDLQPLIWISAGFTILCLLLLPIVKGVKDESKDSTEAES